MPKSKPLSSTAQAVLEAAAQRDDRHAFPPGTAVARPTGPAAARTPRWVAPTKAELADDAALVSK